MTKEQLEAMVNAVFMLGVSDAIAGNARSPSQYPDFAGAYYTGFDTHEILETTRPFTLARAGAGFDDGAAKKPMDLSLSIPSKTIPVVDTVVWTDLTMVYKDAYAAGEKSVGTSCPVPTECPPCPTCPTPGSPGACPEESHMGLWIAALGVAGLAFGVGYVLADKSGGLVPAKQNPQSRLGQVHLQGVGWVNGKSAGRLQPGDKLMWNYGYVSTVEKVERISPQFVMVITRQEDGTKFDRKMKIDRLVALAK